jgi:prophage antirepressor-like protein
MQTKSTIDMATIIDNLNTQSSPIKNSLVDIRKNESSVFEKTFNGNNIRVFKINDDFYFVGKDVANTLNYSNTRDAINSHCDDKIAISDLCRESGMATPNEIKDLEALRLDPQTIVITEFDVYALILRSKKPEAKKFQKWVYSVIQDIRKTGSYNSVYSNESINELIMTVTKLIEEKSTIEFDGMRKKVVYPSMDIKSFSRLIEKEYNIEFSRNQAYILLRNLDLVQKNNTMPTKNAIKNNKLNIETFPLMYTDGYIGRATRTVILKDTIPDLIGYMKMTRMID